MGDYATTRSPLIIFMGLIYGILSPFEHQREAQASLFKRETLVTKKVHRQRFFSSLEHRLWLFKYANLEQGNMHVIV